jgi:hypothetical protein
MGTALQGIMYFPYALQLANGLTRLPLMICTVMVLTMVPQVIVLTWIYHASGGAMAWLIVNVLYLFLGTWLTHRHLLKGIGKKWIFMDVGVPLYLSMTFGLIGHFGIQNMNLSIYWKLINGVGLTLTVVLLSVLFSIRLRRGIASDDKFKVKRSEIILRNANMPSKKEK